MDDKKIDIKIFVMPDGACSYEKSWAFAVEMVSKRLKTRMGDIFQMKRIELFSPESFSYKEIMEGIQMEKLQVPVVTLNGRIIQSGGKLSESKIKKALEKEKSQ